MCTKDVTSRTTLGEEGLLLYHVPGTLKPLWNIVCTLLDSRSVRLEELRHAK